MPALILSPDAVIRFKGGRAVLHNPYSPEAALQTGDSAAIAFVSRFASPQDPLQVLQTLPAAFRVTADELLQRLVRAGVLVPVSGTAAAATERGVQDAVRGLQTLAQSVHALAGDTLALGEAAAAELHKSGLGLAERVFGLLAAVDGMHEGLTAVRQRVLAEQLKTIAERPRINGLILHLGAGGHSLEGWVNIDVAPADLTLNLNWGLPFEIGSVRVIYAAHVLEHLYYPEEALGFLRECRRVLRPGGRLRVVVPDIEQCLRAYCANDREFFEERRKVWKDWPPGRTPLEDFLAYAGAGPRPGDFLESHKYGYDFLTLERALKQAGFLKVDRSSFMASPQQELRVDRASAVAGAQHGKEHYSLFVEAVA